MGDGLSKRQNKWEGRSIEINIELRLNPIPVNEILKLRQTFTRRGLQTFSEMPDSRYYPTLQRFLFFNKRSGLGFAV